MGERITCNPAESLGFDVSRQLNVLHQADACFSRYDIRHIAIHATECAAPGRLMFQSLRYLKYRDTCIYV
ncbi:hypothetical protein T265_03427 [Opisthorchis viverrini]|uniref:Uncharacterized protein n=1 Tax=Opisthorchis viverrini TaxID=6198 RepID=A0A075AHK7_OPIVI|nr:hypothetical protein T265_03427 [Opisthorchis viverrini]KER30054.1 hypothetical protein T265_03427 [Opisthorchis viverrini]